MKVQYQLQSTVEVFDHHCNLPLFLVLLCNVPQSYTIVELRSIIKFFLSGSNDTSPTGIILRN